MSIAVAANPAFRTLRFEPWGCGASEPPSLDCTIDTVVDGIVELWDRIGILRSSAVGLGFGGSTALYLALRHPDRVTRVVACCCRARQPDDRRQFWRDRQALARANGLDELADITVHTVAAPTLLVAAENDHGGGPVGAMERRRSRCPVLDSARSTDVATSVTMRRPNGSPV